MSGKTLYVATSHFVDSQLGGVTRRQLLPNLSEEKAAQLLELKVIAPVLKPEPETESTVAADAAVTVDDLPVDEPGAAVEPEPEPVAEPAAKPSKKKA